MLVVPASGVRPVRTSLLEVTLDVEVDLLQIGQPLRWIVGHEQRATAITLQALQLRGELDL